MRIVEEEEPADECESEGEEAAEEEVPANVDEVCHVLDDGNDNDNGPLPAEINLDQTLNDEIYERPITPNQHSLNTAINYLLSHPDQTHRLSMELFNTLSLIYANALKNKNIVNKDTTGLARDLEAFMVSKQYHQLRRSWLNNQQWFI